MELLNKKTNNKESQFFAITTVKLSTFFLDLTFLLPPIDNSTNNVMFVVMTDDGFVNIFD